MDNEIAQVAVLKKDLSNEERMQFDVQFASQRKNPTVALVLSLFLGMLGIDRFYLGQIGYGLVKLFTFGGLGLLAIIDWFLIMGAARAVNIQKATQIRDSLMQTRSNFPETAVYAR